MRFVILLSLLLCGGNWGHEAFAASPVYPEICDPATGCPPVIAATRFQSFPAYIFNNGLTAATVVPALGRVMSFGLSDKSTFNGLWDNHSPNKNQLWKNWGGAKTWLAPQGAWPQIAGGKWPPDPAWTEIVKSEVLTGGFLQTTSAISPHSGIRFVNQYGHGEDGDFFIRQTAEKKSGKPLQMALWHVAQIKPPQAVFFVMNPGSTLEQSRGNLSGAGASRWSHHGNVGCYYPGTGTPMKFGIRTSVPVFGALYNNLLFVLRATPQNGLYPDATKFFPEGFPLEIFDTGPQSQPYLELEVLSPLRKAYKGSRWTFTVTWNIYQLPGNDLESPELQQAVSKIMNYEL
jgi:hypothetical protein